MIRCIDILFALMGLALSLPIFLIVIIIGYLETGSPIFLQTRVGKNQVPFTLYKFRTMSIGTESIASHLVSASSVTRLGAFLRKTKIDELPQLFNVLKGEMSFVGPRPCLFNQSDLIDERNKLGVFDVLPGITGLAQVNKIDMSNPKLLAEWDLRMMNEFSVVTYFKYILLTVTGKGLGDRISSG